ncbi:MAG: hypothetical protein WCA79_13835 [Anaerolineales bacterium]
MEGLIYYIGGLIILWLICSFGSLIIFLLGSLLFLFGKYKTRGTSKSNLLIRLSGFIAILGLLIFLTCIFIPGKYLYNYNRASQNQIVTIQPLHMNDDIMKPFVNAMEQVNRESLGFSSIPSDARVEVEGTIGKTDVALHVYTTTSHYIYFEKNANSYAWVYEQEVFTGRHLYSDVDGVFNEQIVIDYQTKPINGIQLL